MNANDFLRMFAYDHWANRECLGRLRVGDSPPGATLGKAGHILSAQKLWLERLQSRRQSMPVWPSSTIDECITLADEMAVAWRRYLDGLPQGGLDKEVDYRNSKGEPWSSRVEDVLLHVILHSAYHRGQIAVEMRMAGKEPALTDFIHAVRQGFVK
jgi:uncharacterized damage-inducible protein DinB